MRYSILYIEYRIEYCTELSFEYFMSFLWSLIGFVCIIRVHNLYPYFGKVATCYLLDRVCIHISAVELGRVETCSWAESSCAEFRTSQWSGQDRLMLTPECSSCSGGLVRYLEWIGLFSQTYWDYSSTTLEYQTDIIVRSTSHFLQSFLLTTESRATYLDFRNKNHNTDCGGRHLEKS